MTLSTLLLLRRVLVAQQLHVGDDGFRDAARAVLAALDELDAAILLAQASPESTPGG